METNKSDNVPYIPTRQEFHQHFGGYIYESDYDTYYGGDYALKSHYAARIAYDMRREKNVIKWAILKGTFKA